MENKNPKLLNLHLSVDEINKILAALGNLPYAQVFSLVQEIHKQVEPQLSNDQDNPSNERDS